MVRYEPDPIGSYHPDDVLFLLRDLSHLNIEKTVEEREINIQSGKKHYAEMLPIEYQPSEEYFELYQQILGKNATKVAEYVAIVGEKLASYHGLEHLVLVSLARAGTPIGILLKRYFKERYNVTLPHYTISIIRDRGIDETALQYIVEKHPEGKIQFVDGWTGKGAITQELDAAIVKWNQKHTFQLQPYLAVLTDPGYCAHFFGTQDDFLIPSACLNSTVSGLVSRTVLNLEFMAVDDFHGAKYYRELAEFDVSNDYIKKIISYFTTELYTRVEQKKSPVFIEHPKWLGIKGIEGIQKKFGIQSIHHIKPGVGETTRVLLRRIPWKILIHPDATQDLSHIVLLAKQRNVEIVYYEEMSYACCGLIKELT